MRIYIDEDTAATFLIKLLRHAGHDVSVPIEVGTTGLSDARQFTLAISDSRPVLTMNYDDFKDLHNLVRTAAGKHPGLLVIRKDNDSTRDLSPRGIVNAIRKLEQAGAAIENQYIVLNQWR